jgi:hypothetical protein
MLVMDLGWFLLIGVIVLGDEFLGIYYGTAEGLLTIDSE